MESPIEMFEIVIFARHVYVGRALILALQTAGADGRSRNSSRWAHLWAQRYQGLVHPQAYLSSAQCAAGQSSPAPQPQRPILCTETERTPGRWIAASVATCNTMYSNVIFCVFHLWLVCVQVFLEEWAAVYSCLDFRFWVSQPCIVWVFSWRCIMLILVFGFAGLCEVEVEMQKWKRSVLKLSCRYLRNLKLPSMCKLACSTTSTWLVLVLAVKFTYSMHIWLRQSDCCLTYMQANSTNIYLLDMLPMKVEGWSKTPTAGNRWP